ncbi:hypothetical protein [Leifsonia shinshuensis]|uniref:Uncharacterized protein n=1 Tax=Leifsonia shinshuensis TaxID=150026 RepID=A0A853D115_9MICO|nr:hypothetical protein [Leifsonia shinshuensis]NYJ24445.1 hypothetical protein [Leifsonia shinshuensis]
MTLEITGAARAENNAALIARNPAYANRIDRVHPGDGAGVRRSDR